VTERVRSLIIIPTYNEAENLEPLISAVLGLDAGFEILVVDDNSPDGTGEIADRLSKE
jgi:dolichol-phosphate mannosyltransferase